MKLDFLCRQRYFPEGCSSTTVLKKDPIVFELEDNSIAFSHQQSNTWQNRYATSDLLFFVTHSSNKSLEFHGESSVITFNISEAFDSVWHAGLLHKYFLTTPFLSTLWISSYLSEIRISVVFLPYQCRPIPEIGSCNNFLLNTNKLLVSTSNLIHNYAGETTLRGNF